MFNFNNSQGGSTTGNSLFGGSNTASNTNTTTGLSLFGGNTNQTTSNTNNTTNSSLFGGNNSQSANNTTNSSLFGGNTNNAGGSSLFGNNAGSNTTNSGFGSGLFGSNPSTIGTANNSSLNFSANNTNQSQQSQSLFGMSSAFSYSNDKNVIHNLAEQKLRESVAPSNPQENFSSMPLSAPNTNAPASYALSSGQSQTNLYSSNNSSVNGLNLNSKFSSSLYRKPPITPAWAKEKRYSSSQPSLQHVSSFTKNDRAPSTSSHRKSSLSLSHSPSATFGNSFSGVSKPITKKKTFIQEDPPPTKSIYELDSSSFSSFKSDASTSGDNAKNPTQQSKSSSSSEPKMTQVVDSVSVIIFGFPASLTPAVVTYFSRFGNILENVDSARRLQTLKGKSTSHPPIHTGKNWLKITYDNPASASRAIQENGTIFDGQYIIGCFPVTSHRLKEFEKACEMSMQSSEFPNSTTKSTLFNFTPTDDTNKKENDLDSNASNTAKKTDSGSVDKSVFGSSNKTSKPAISGSRHANIKDGRHIFNTPAKQRYSSALFKIAHDPETFKQSKEIRNPANSKSFKSNNLGWLSWTGKKAQELVFGWDDL